MSFVHTPASKKLEADVRELNEFLSRQQIEGGVNHGYIRIFQNGDEAGFNWNYGGRLYSQPPATIYQQLSKKKRLKMTINGEAVAEIDIRASYLTLFYGWFGAQLDLNSDPYLHPADPDRSIQSNLEVNMKMVKSLILGSAAGLLAMSGAQAADLPVKAKPVEYVKICSLYGAGFFYIPGTDTCLKLGGYLRIDTTFNGGVYDAPFWNGSGGGGDRFADFINGRSRMALTVDTRTATEYGVVRTFMQGDFQFQNFGTHNGNTGSTGPGGGIGSSGAGGQAFAAAQLSGINS